MLGACTRAFKRSNLSLSFVMHRQLALDASPPICRGMRILDRSAFHKTLPLLAVRVPPAKVVEILNAEPMKRVIINLPKVRSVVSDPSDASGRRLVLLRFSEETGFPPVAKEFLAKGIYQLTTYNLQLGYDYWTADEIFQAILPEELLDGSPTGFAIIGHIAHMNLNEEYLPYKHIIGQVILDKNKTIKTVVNKLDSIDNQFRFFKMELIAGIPDYVVTHHESDCRFTFDFTQVYWNSRLHSEHDRLVKLFNPTDVVADVFAGVGPFAIPAAKKGCAIFANDLNPSSTKYLSKNVQDNRVSDLVRVFCEDGRDFIRTVAERLWNNPFLPYAGPKLSRSQEKELRKKRQNVSNNEGLPLGLGQQRRAISHFVMNLPDSAIGFLDAFRGILSFVGDKERDSSGFYASMPMIHCHCFTRELERGKAEVDIRQRVEEKLGQTISDVTFHLVRSVAPNKDMYCISFRLPRSIAYAT